MVQESSSQKNCLQIKSENKCLYNNLWKSENAPLQKVEVVVFPGPAGRVLRSSNPLQRSPPTQQFSDPTNHKEPNTASTVWRLSKKTDRNNLKKIHYMLCSEEQEERLVGMSLFFWWLIVVSHGCILSPRAPSLIKWHLREHNWWPSQSLHHENCDYPQFIQCLVHFSLVSGNQDQTLSLWPRDQCHSSDEGI